MKKKVFCILALIMLCIIGAVIIPTDIRNPHIEMNAGKLALSVSTEEEDIVLFPWKDESSGIYYFFLPSFVDSNQILTGMWNRPIINWKENEIYDIETADLGNTKSYSVSFRKASVIPAMFISTESGSMDAIHANKEYEETGELMVVAGNGTTEYKGALERISGRGNTSWEYEKKPYSIKLAESQELCGLQKGKKWNLLPLWREGNKMNTKVLFDIAAVAGLRYSPESTWVDLYLNNEYAGIYLLSESISVSGGRVEIFDLEEENYALNPDLEYADRFDDGRMKGYEILNNPENITGGYLIEKDLEAYYKEETVGFVTDLGMTFSIAAPQHASKEQVKYIREYVQKIEKMLQEKDNGVLEYVDVDSFTAKYLIDEISLNFDTNITSMFFYKEKDDNLLYAGPVWDYDSALGECNAGYAEGWYVDYNNSILNKGSEFNWYAQLYEYDIFQDSVERQYRLLLPYLNELIDNTIDLYAASIKDSVAMDSLRWKNVEEDKPGNYAGFDSNVRYLKYFLCNRLNWLNDSFGVSNYTFHWNETEAEHEVLFVQEENVVKHMPVKDGQILDELPFLDEEKYLGWYFKYNDEKYRPQIPILEDTVLYAREK